MEKNQNFEAQKFVEEGFLESLMALPACRFIQTNWKQISYGFLLFLILLVLLYRFFAYQNAQSEQDFISAIQSAAILTNPETAVDKRERALLDLSQAVEQHSNLHAKYDGLIGQQLLIENQVEKALPFIERVFSRVDEVPYYTDYAQATLLIEEEKSDQALLNAYALKEALLKDPKASDFGILYTFNLLRIALLEGKESKAWDELKKMDISQENLRQVMAHFGVEGFAR